MTSPLRIVCWNINEGEAGLPRIANYIRSKSPDIVLLNEIRLPNLIWETFFNKINQTKELARALGLPYHIFAKTNTTGITGWKGVAVISRFPLGPWKLCKVKMGAQETCFGTLVTSVEFNGKSHHILSTRFAPHNDDGNNRRENAAGIEQALKLVREELSPDSPIIFGGDFNASIKPDTNEYEESLVQFIQRSGLKEGIHESTEKSRQHEHRVDYLFYRGDYKVHHVEYENSDPKGSDHPCLFMELTHSRSDETPVV